MSCPSRLEEFEHYIRKRFVEDGVSQLQVSDEMKALLPECIGFSERSIKTSIHRTSRLSKDALQQAVTLGVSQVRPFQM